MTEVDAQNWTPFTGRLLRGHQVASGRNGDPRFPGGTLRMQAPHFQRLGVDLTPFHAGTLNVSIAPRTYRVVRPRVTLRQVRWHPTEPAEDFSFFDVRLTTADGGAVDGLVYYPHPDTKPAHFQPPDVLELLLRFVPGLAVGADLPLAVRADQMAIDP